MTVTNRGWERWKVEETTSVKKYKKKYQTTWHPSVVQKWTSGITRDGG